MRVFACVCVCVCVCVLVCVIVLIASECRPAMTVGSVTFGSQFNGRSFANFNGIWHNQRPRKSISQWNACDSVWIFLRQLCSKFNYSSIMTESLTGRPVPVKYPHVDGPRTRPHRKCYQPTGDWVCALMCAVSSTTCPRRRWLTWPTDVRIPLFAHIHPSVE